MRYAVVTSPIIDPLRFINKEVPREVVQDILSQDNFSIFRAFLHAESGMERHNQIDKAALEQRNNKIRLLLLIDFIGVQRFIRDNISEEWIAPGVKADLASILEEFKSRRSLNSKY